MTTTARDLATRCYPPNLIGWRIVRRPKDEAIASAAYANGAAKWVNDPRRGFIFTTTAGQLHRDARGLNHGLRWAMKHRDHLRSLPENKGWKLTIVRVLRVVRRERKAG